MTRPATTRPAGPGWLLAAPHRLAFAAGVSALILIALWWAGVGLASWLGQAPVAGLPTRLSHGLLMSFGFMPFFFAGFLFTAGPRWLDQPSVPVARLVLPLSLLWIGVLLLLAAAMLPTWHIASGLGAVALALMTLGWGLLSLRFAALLRTSQAEGRLHARLIAVACTFGGLTLAAACVALARQAGWAALAAANAALWGFVGVVFVTVAHRIIPFFAEPRRHDPAAPPWMLAGLLAILLAQALLAITAPWRGTPTGTALTAQATVEAVAGLALLARARHWARVQSLKPRMLAMLFGGFVWLGLALTLAAVSHGLEAAGAGTLGLAPLHAYTMGFLGSTMLAMVGRIAAGHGGRAVAADGWLWALFGLLQGTVLVRLAAAAGAPDGAGIALAAVMWALVALGWGGRMLGWFLRPRPDGRPG